jgi:hypothetical protein
VVRGWYSSRIRRASLGKSQNLFAGRRATLEWERGRTFAERKATLGRGGIPSQGEGRQCSRPACLAEISLDGLTRGGGAGDGGIRRRLAFKAPTEPASPWTERVNWRRESRRAFCRFFSRIVRKPRVSIEFVVASVASRRRIPGFRVDEMAESRKWVHNILSFVSIADTGVGARGRTTHVSGTGNDYRRKSSGCSKSSRGSKSLGVDLRSVRAGHRPGRGQQECRRNRARAGGTGTD